MEQQAGKPRQGQKFSRPEPRTSKLIRNNLVLVKIRSSPRVHHLTLAPPSLGFTIRKPPTLFSNHSVQIYMARDSNYGGGWRPSRIWSNKILKYGVKLLGLSCTEQHKGTGTDTSQYSIKNNKTKAKQTPGLIAGSPTSALFQLLQTSRR